MQFRPRGNVLCWNSIDPKLTLHFLLLAKARDLESDANFKIKKKYVLYTNSSTRPRFDLGTVYGWDCDKHCDASIMDNVGMTVVASEDCVGAS